MSEQPTGSLLLELDVLLNRYSREQASNTPDFILAEFMFRSLEAFEWACRRREMWYGRALTPGGVRLDWAGTTGTSVNPEAGTVSIDNGTRFPVTRCTCADTQPDSMVHMKPCPVHAPEGKP